MTSSKEAKEVLMRIDNPAVTLDDEARTAVEKSSGSGFLDWLHSFSVHGSDGNEYMLGGSILSLFQEKLDVVSINIAEGYGASEQLASSIYKVGRYPGMKWEWMLHNPAGTLTIERNEHSVLVSCGKEYHVECFDDHRWHIMVTSPDGRYSADLYHEPHGNPLWYGREKPSYLTQHSVTYGYNWSGNVHGRICLEGTWIDVEGSGIRERYAASDSSAAELGGWEDWGWFCFNEIHSSLYDMRLGMKDLAVNDIENGRYYPEGKMTIEHEDWTFIRELDGFIPAIYKVKIELDGGLFEIRAHVGNVTTWGVTHKVPDNPVATLHYDNVEGSFTDMNGKVRSLTGGRGTMSIRQWHPYPSILPRELYSDEIISGEKFTTL